MFPCPFAPLALKVAVSVTWVAMDTLKCAGSRRLACEDAAERSRALPRAPAPPCPAGSRGLVHTRGGPGLLQHLRRLHFFPKGQAVPGRCPASAQPIAAFFLSPKAKGTPGRVPAADVARGALRLPWAEACGAHGAGFPVGRVRESAHPHAGARPAGSFLTSPGGRTSPCPA